MLHGNGSWSFCCRVTSSLSLALSRPRSIPGSLLYGSAIPLYRVLFWISAGYLFSLLLVFFLQPFSKTDYTYAQNLHAADTGLYGFSGVAADVTTGNLLAYRINMPGSIIEIGEPGVFISYAHEDKQTADST